jgi:hypothetical protein
MPARSSTVVSLFEIHSRTEPEPRQPTPGRERSRSISGERGATAAGGHRCRVRSARTLRRDRSAWQSVDEKLSCAGTLALELVVFQFHDAAKQAVSVGGQGDLQAPLRSRDLAETYM